MLNHSSGDLVKHFLSVLFNICLETMKPKNVLTPNIWIVVHMYICKYDCDFFVYFLHLYFLGFHALSITAALLIVCVWLGMPLGYLFELILPLAVCAIGLSYLLSMYLYIRSFWAPQHALSLGGNTGEIISSIYLQISVVSYIIYKVCFTFRYSRCCCCLSFWNICQLSFFIICRKSSVWLLHGSRAQPSHWRLWLEVFLWTETWFNRLGKSLIRCLQPYVCMCIRFFMFLKIVILTKARFDQKCSTQLHGEILL